MEKNTPSLPPAPAPDACPPRPAAPFALSMLLAAKTGGSGGEQQLQHCANFVLPNVVLRKVAPQPIFAVRTLPTCTSRVNVCCVYIFVSNDVCVLMLWWRM